jgi:hypothetical protein
MTVRRGSVLTLVLLFAPGAEAYVHKYAAAFLDTGVGARALAMGGAFVAVADDATAAYWNPAGLAQLEGREFTLMHAGQWANVVKRDFLNIALSGEESYAVSLYRVGVDDIPYTNNALLDYGTDGLPDADEAGYDPETNPDPGGDNYDPEINPSGTEGNDRLDDGERIDTDKVKWVNDVEWALFGSYARAIGKFMVGGSVKVLRQGIGDDSILGLEAEDSMFGLGLDLGIIYPVNRWLKVGACLQDALGTMLFYNNGTKQVRTPLLKVGGAAQIPLSAARSKLLLAADADIRFEGRRFASQLHSGDVSVDLRFGLEYAFMDFLALRLGAEPTHTLDSDGDKSVGWHRCAGAGIRHRWLEVNYAHLEWWGVDDEGLGDCHRVSAAVRL